MKVSFNFRFIIFATAFVIGIQGLEYGDLEATNTACPEFDSCSERDENDIYAEKNCECDSSCVTYNNCCIDSIKSSKEKLNPSRFTCMPFSSYSSRGNYVINTCQQDWQGPDEVKRKCEVLNDLSDPLMTTPATDIQRNVTYLNRYCAECNRATPDVLSSWKIHIYCDGVTDIQGDIGAEEFTYRDDLNEWGVMKGNSYYPCKIVFLVPASLFNNVRDCMGNITETCPSTWRDVTIKSLCEAYMAIIVHNNDVYRNPHCALCNGVKLDQTNCKNILGKIKMPGALGMLFDVNRRDSGIVGVKVPNKLSCPHGQRYDPFIKKGCREVSCGLPGLAMINGKCVKS